MTSEDSTESWPSFEGEIWWICNRFVFGCLLQIHHYDRGRSLYLQEQWNKSTKMDNELHNFTERTSTVIVIHKMRFLHKLVKSSRIEMTLMFLLPWERFDRVRESASSYWQKSFTVNYLNTFCILARHIYLNKLFDVSNRMCGFTTLHPPSFPLFSSTTKKINTKDKQKTGYISKHWHCSSKMLYKTLTS